MFGLFKKKPAVDLGKPIVIVSGLPRSGTSMCMKMMDAAGYEIVQDGIRTADDDNPKGYYEDERVKDLERNLDKSWLKDCRGKALKVISFLLKELPQANRYKVLFMRRPLEEVLASQNKMLVNRGEDNPASDQEMRRIYVEHLEQLAQLRARHKTMEWLEIDYRAFIDDPQGQARIVSEFLGGGHDVEKMASVVDKKLYRNRANA